MNCQSRYVRLLKLFYLWLATLYYRQDSTASRCSFDLTAGGSFRRRSSDDSSSCVGVFVSMNRADLDQTFDGGFSIISESGPAVTASRSGDAGIFR